MTDRFLEGRRILVLEDDYFAAQGVQHIVEDLGGTVVGPVGRLDRAQQLARAEPLDGAILDIRIDETTSYPLARELIRANIPVVFLTGYKDDSIEAEFKGVPRVSKPFDSRSGERVLRDTFR